MYEEAAKKLYIVIKLEPFTKSAYADFISWINSEEMLMQVTGPTLSFPLTIEQLDKSLADKNRFAFSVIEVETGENIGHCEIYLLEDSAKLGRIIIGNKNKKGKGYGKQIVNALIQFVFNNLDKKKIELNVFEWNIEAIKCYERVGFKINPDKILERKIKEQTWMALNMILDNEAWNKNNLTLK